MAECAVVSQSPQMSQAPYSSYFVLDGGSYACLVCRKDPSSSGFTASKRQAIVRHVKKQHLNYSHTCNECSRVFRSEEMLEIHMQRFQHGLGASQPKSRAAPYSSYFVATEGYYACTVCTEEPFRAAKRQTVVRHVKKQHLHYEHVCQECSRVFRTKEMLNTHMERHQHGQEQAVKAPYSSYFKLDDTAGCYECLVCADRATPGPFRCRKRQSIVRHVKTAHLNYSHTCPECSRAFCTQEMLEFHMERQGHTAHE